MKFLIFVLLFNYWIYKIFSINFFVGLIILVFTFLLYKYLKEKGKKIPKKLIILFLFVLLLQMLSTQKQSLVNISNDNRREIDMRLKAYPLKYLRIGHWLEERKESIAFSRVLNNFFENIDPNLYFFNNHPRERVGVKEFEKFPYVLFPVFLVGLLKIVKDKNKKILTLFYAIPIILLSFFGNLNPMGPFSVFPFFAITISEGLKPIYIWINKRSRFLKISIYVLFFLIFIQGFLYEIY